MIDCFQLQLRSKEKERVGELYLIYVKKSKLWIVAFFLYSMLSPILTSAHAYIAKSTPMENEILMKVPPIVSIEFNETIQSSSFNSLIVVDASGKRVDLKNTHINKENPRVMEARIKQNIPDGIYSIQWKVISADGHPIQGVIPFSIGTTSKDARALQARTEGYIPKVDMLIERGLLYTSFSLYIGILFFHLVIQKSDDQAWRIQSRSQTILRISLLGMLISVLFNLPLQTTINADISWSEAFNPSLLKETLKLPDFGYMWVIQIILVILLAAATYVALKRGSLSSFHAWGIPCIFIVGLLVTKAFTGHAVGSKYKEITVSMDFLHLLAASLWTGGLASIIFLLPAWNDSRENEKRDWSRYWEAIHRFTPWATTAVLVIFFTGIINSTLFVPTIHSLFYTSYGQVLLAKTILFVGMGVLGIIHLVKNKIRRSKGLGMTARVEWSMGIIVMVLAALLTNLPTPPLPATGPFHETKLLDNGDQLTLNVSPNTVGMNTFTIDLKDKNGQSVTDIEQLTLTTSSLDMEMGKETFRVPVVSPGTFQTEGMYLNMTGRWIIQVHGLTTSLDSFDIDFHLTVGNRQ